MKKILSKLNKLLTPKFVSIYISISILISLTCFVICYAAWDPTRPTDDEYKYLVPSVVRANWLAIALGTDPALLITNIKIAANAAIADTKLAAITTANKVSAAALYALANLPSGAGLIPIANIPTITAGKGGTNADSSASTGIPKVTAGTWTFNATQDDLGDGTTYRRYNPASVAINGGNVNSTTQNGGNISNTTINIGRTSDPATPGNGEIWFRTDL